MSSGPDDDDLGADEDEGHHEVDGGRGVLEDLDGLGDDHEGATELGLGVGGQGDGGLRAELGAGIDALDLAVS